VPDFAWSVSLLLILAFLAAFAAPALAPSALCSNLEMTHELLRTIWEAELESYRAEVFEIIARRMKSYRDENRGYGDIGIYIEELRSGFTLGHDAERTELDEQGEYTGYYHTASVAKLLIAYAFYYLDDQGEVSIWDTYTDPVVGMSYQFQPTIHRMLTHSVNLNHNILLRYLGADRLKETLRRLDLDDSRIPREIGWAPGTSDAASLERYGTLQSPCTTPRDLGKILAHLYRGDVLSPENNHRLLTALTNTIYNSRIPRAIGYAVPVAHKTGTKDWVYNDAALVLLPENPFVLVVLTRGAPSRVQTLMRQIALDIFRYHQERARSGDLREAELLYALLNA
jgi:hypothetical protein